MSNKRKLLVVDDIDLNRLILTDLFSEEYEVIEAENGRQALDIIGEDGDGISMVLLDIIMPEIDGFGVLQEMQNRGLMNKVPVIFITGENDDEIALKGYALGVSDLINKPFNPDIVERRVRNVVDLYTHKQNLEQKLMEQKEALEKQAEKLSRSNLFVIDALSTTVEFRSFESGDHIKRIRMLTKILLQGMADEYKLSEEEIESISSASAMHDIGKIAIPDNILLKPGPLTDEEFEIMKTHTTRGCEILSRVSSGQEEKFFTYCYEICRHHHERWDGRGYPDGLKGDEISIWAQATSLADVYDALTSKRVYKDAFGHEEAVRMIVNGECGTFNPAMLKVFTDVQYDLLEEIILSKKETAAKAEAVS